jgi:ATP-binding cassette, subfamily C, bacterial LapB
MRAREGRRSVSAVYRAAAAELPPSARLPDAAQPGGRDFPWMAAASTAINLLALALPLLMLQVFDRILPHRSLDTLMLLMLGTLAAVAAEAVLRLMRAYVMVWAAARFEHGAMNDAFSRLLNTPAERIESGGYVDRFKAIVALKDHASGQTVLQLLDLPFTLLYLGLVTAIGGWLVLVPLAGVAVFAYVSWVFGAHHGALFRDRNSADRRRSNFLVETLSGIHTVKALAMEAFMLRRYERLQETCANLTRRLASALDVSSGVGGLFGPLMTVLVVAAGGYMVVRGDMTNGELAACILLVLRSLGPLQRAGSLWIAHQRVRSLYEEIGPLFRGKPLESREGPLAAGAGPLAAGAGRIELRDACFRLPEADGNLIDGVSLALEPGECVVIKGANGSGRSTLLRLMGGLAAPASGEVRLDGVAMSAMKTIDLRAAIAYVPENAMVFQGTILENITGFDPSRTDRALAIARDLGLDKFVSRLPRGWESSAGEAAADTLPVGHRQRIAMVRALASGARVVLFDAANISMDSEGDASLRKYLEAEKGRTTFVIVTHRPSLEKLADRIYVLEAGRLSLVEAGAAGAPPAEAAAAPPPPAEPLPETAPGAPAAAPQPDGPDAAWQRLRQAVTHSFARRCDLAECLPELLRALNWRGEARDVAESLPYFEDELDISGMQNCMAQLGFQSGQAEIALGEIDRRLLPCLFLPEGGAALVLLERTGGGLRAFDPGAGESMLEGAAADPLRRGRAFFFTRTQAAAQTQSSWAMRALSRMRPLVGHAMLSAVIYGLVLLPVPLFVMAVYGYVMPSGSLVNLAYFTVGAAVAIAIGGIFIVHRARILSFIAGRIDFVFGTAVFKQILALPPSMSETAGLGSQIARLNSFESVRDIFTGPLASTLLELPALIAFIIALGVINPPALLAVAVTTLLYIALYLLFAGSIDRRVAEMATRTTRRHEFLVETVGKLRAIRDFGGERIWLARFRELSSAATMAGYRVGRVSALLAAGGYLITMIGSLTVVVVSIVWAAQGVFGVGVVIASMMLAWRIVGPVQTAFVNLTRIDRVRNAVGQMDRLMALRGERLPQGVSLASREIRGRVEFERVSFRYSLDTDPALIGASFTVEPGKLVAITGPNGGGKSTMLKLLAGLYQPQAGSVRIDETDLRQIDPIELRRAIGYVPQESSLFRGTIAQNLRLVRPAATNEELSRALALAGALNDVALLPEGINTRAGDGLTDRMPASLRQKLSLARAYLTMSPILLFDEPANTLDLDGDRWFVEALRKLKGRSTIFLVTHRPSHIRLADMAVVLQGGYLRYAGPPAEALKRLGIGA